ncbi:MAG: hypothetical protein QOD51_1211 [Candidatus Eremiobacteraeota bacterium]|nr:hypothetical protein [Candidatus Eremiobacteraeota bacterium]
MISKRSPSRPKQPNGIRRAPPVEPLSARAFRLRIASGYSAHELAAAAGVFVGEIHRLEAGKPVDKRILAGLAHPLNVPLCRLICGEHDCTERACI